MANALHRKMAPMYLENIAAPGIKYRMVLNGYRPNVSPLDSYPTLFFHVLLSVRTFAMVLVLVFIPLLTKLR